MNRLIVSLGAALFLFAQSPVSGADLEKGKAELKAKNFDAAIAELRPLAESGDPEAQHYLGLVYVDQRNAPEALKWQLMAAEQGHGLSQVWTGLLYAMGDIDGNNRDYAQAKVWYERASANGQASADDYLGMIYEQGFGVEKDLPRALALYHQSAERGFKGAQYRLGTLYERGKNVEQDYARAAKWYRMAADQGHAHAAGSLGVLYAKGWGVGQDLISALQWLYIAVALGNAEMKPAMEQVRNAMTVDERKQAAERIQNHPLFKKD